MDSGQRSADGRIPGRSQQASPFGATFWMELGFFVEAFSFSVHCNNNIFLRFIPCDNTVGIVGSGCHGHAATGFALEIIFLIWPLLILVLIERLLLLDYFKSLNGINFCWRWKDRYHPFFVSNVAAIQ
ncbi:MULTISPECIES: hypothetical protein [Microbulbifer]|uniref:hypothetical protein n=1 Tax=Microbulbifer TaxID=48073 RepID=UPI001E63030F|nr:MULTISPECIES: hypothetical protein [Microbulbifer]UHQ56677.1 hypothetical protein LVE68_06830 [Microbulbifer sp. YPW16]